MEILGIFIFIAAICNFFLGFFVFIKEPSKRLNRLFGIFGLIMGIWVFNNFILTSIQQIPFWIKNAYALGSLVPVSAMLWVLDLCDKKINKLKIILIGGLGFLFFVISHINGLIINVKKVYSYGFEGETGPLFILYSVYILGTLIFTVYTLVLEYYKAKGIRKIQLSYVLIGAILTISIVLVVSFVLPLLGNLKFSRLDSPSSLILLAFTAYAIVRYRLMDIRVVLGHSAIYLLSFITVILLAFSLMYLNVQLAQPLTFNTVLLLGAFSSLLFFQTVKLYEKIAGKYFYHALYNTQIIITDLEERLTQVLELQTFSSLILNTLKNTLKLEKIGILTKEIGKETYTIQKTINFSENDLLSQIKDGFLLQYLQKTKQPIVREELTPLIEKAKAERKEKEKPQTKEKLKQLQDNLKKVKISLCLPLIFEGKLIGIIFIGDKVSEEAFSSQDIEMLTILSHSASIALKNASLYSEVKNRKEELERFYRLTVGRELRMVELKKKILELEEKIKKEKP